MSNVSPRLVPGERPRLVDFLVVAEGQRLDIGLRMWVGTIEVGLVGTSGGRVVFAELPGATGDTALQLLASLTEARVVPEAWTARVTNVEGDWRSVVGERDLGGSSRAQRLANARAALAELHAHEVDLDVGVDPSVAEQPALRVALDALDWAAVSAYLSGELDRAQQLLDRRVSIGGIAPVPRANLERVRLRLLEDELEDQWGGRE